MERVPSASYSLTLRVKLSTRAGTLGEVATAIGRAGGDIGAIDIVSAGSDYIVRDITVSATSSEHGEKIVEAVKDIDGIEVINVSDRTFLMHLGGKIEVVSKMPLNTDRRSLEILLLTSFLLASIFFSLSRGLGGRSRVSQTEGEAGPTSINSSLVLFRTDALTTFQSQRTASDRSKQNRVKNPLTHLGLVSGEFGALSATLRQHLVDDSQSVFYFPVPYSRPGGRAPPLSA